MTELGFVVKSSVPVELVEAIAEAVAARLELPRAHSEAWRLLDVTETAAMLGRSTRWVRDRAKIGDLPWVRLDGGALAFDPDDVREFARSRRVGGPEVLARPLALVGDRRG